MPCRQMVYLLLPFLPTDLYTYSKNLKALTIRLQCMTWIILWISLNSHTVGLLLLLLCFVFTLEQSLIAKSARLMTSLTNLRISQTVTGICYVCSRIFLVVSRFNSVNYHIKRTTISYHYGFIKQSKFSQQKYRRKRL